MDESFDVGSDTGTSVEDKDYQPPFAFNGALSKVTIKLEPVQMSPDDQKAVQDKNGKQVAASEIEVEIAPNIRVTVLRETITSVVRPTAANDSKPVKEKAS